MYYKYNTIICFDLVMYNNISIINNPINPYKKILILGYNKNQTIIFQTLIAMNCLIHHTDKKLLKIKEYDLIISFGYRYILGKRLIHKTKCPIINLHISYLPYNRGSHPNFWSFYDKTPSGVTIHLIDEGIDTGPILYQKTVSFNKKEVTFEQTYNKLKKEIELLFIKNLSKILTHKWVEKPQKGIGTQHNIQDLPKDFSGWKSNIKKEIEKLKDVENKNET